MLNKPNGFGVGVVIGGTWEKSHVVWHSGRRWSPGPSAFDDGAVWWFMDDELEAVEDRAG